jgi:uncharacterized protein YkwD
MSLTTHLSRGRAARRGGALIVAAIAAMAFTGPGAAHAATCAGADTPINQSDITTLNQARDAMICLTNDARATAGLSQLTVDDSLSIYAFNKAYAFADPATGNVACGGVAEAGFKMTRCFEGLVTWKPGPDATAQALFDWMMAHDGSRSALMDSQVTTIGAGVYNGNHADGRNGPGATADVLTITPDAPAGGGNPGGGGNPPAPDCAAAQANYDTTVDQLSRDQAEMAVFCLVNEQRKAAGAPELTLDSSLIKEGEQESDDSVRLRWWSQTDGRVSHINPERGNPDKRIAASGYCANGKVDPNENTFGAAGTPGGPFSPTPRRAVDFWMQDQPHHDTLVNPAYTHTGVGVAVGSAFASVDFNPSGTYVQEFGGCA